MRFVKPLDEKLVMALAARIGPSSRSKRTIMGGAGSGVGELLASQGVQLPLPRISAYPTASSNMVHDTCLASAGLAPRARREYRGLVACILRSGFVRCAAPDIGDPSSLFLKRILDLLSGERLRTLRRRQDRGGTEEIMRHTSYSLRVTLTFACSKPPPALPHRSSEGRSAR